MNLFTLSFISKSIGWPGEGRPAKPQVQQGACRLRLQHFRVANVEADTDGDFIIGLGVIRNSSGGGGLLSSMLLANQCSVVVTTPLAACNVSLAERHWHVERAGSGRQRPAALRRRRIAGSRRRALLLYLARRKGLVIGDDTKELRLWALHKVATNKPAHTACNLNHLANGQVAMLAFDL